MADSLELCSFPRTLLVGYSDRMLVGYHIYGYPLLLDSRRTGSAPAFGKWSCLPAPAGTARLDSQSGLSGRAVPGRFLYAREY